MYLYFKSTAVFEFFTLLTYYKHGKVRVNWAFLIAWENHKNPRRTGNEEVLKSIRKQTCELV